ASPRTPPLTARSRCNPLKLLFYGTPAFALPAFEALRRRRDIVAVITQPDRPAHRGQRVTPPPVKQAALAVGLPVLQPPRLRDPGWPERLAAYGAGLAVVVAFGQILPQAALDPPPRRPPNRHGPLAPTLR